MYPLIMVDSNFDLCAAPALNNFCGLPSPNAPRLTPGSFLTASQAFQVNCSRARPDQGGAEVLYQI
jgi:hypothetical protein